MATATRALSRASARADDRVRVAVLVAVTFAALALLAHGAPGPRVFPDETIYMDAAASLADGNGLEVRGEDYGYGALYPVLVAPLAAVGDRETAFALAQLLNALAFALAAVPVFLLARKVTGPGLALVAAVLSVLVPSSVYASGVLTESVAYLAFACSLLAIVSVVERPTATKQLLAFAAVAAAGSTRTQLLVLAPVLAASLAAAPFLLPAGSRPAWRRLWPTGAVILAAIAVVVALLAGGRSPADLLGAYGVLWKSYGIGDVAGWFLDHAGLLVLYVAVVPAVVAPVELVRWWREARRGSAAHAGLLVTFVAANLVMLVVVAAFASTSYAVAGLHDRSIFYVAPLWFVAFCAWLDSGMARPVSGLAAASLAALVLVAQLPYHFVREILWEMLAFEPWAFVERGNPSGTPFSGREAMLGFVVAASLAAALVPRVSRWVIIGVVGAMLAFTGSLAWAHVREGARSVDAAAFGPGGQRAWVDAAVPAGERVLLLSVPPVRCGEDALRGAMRATEFYNDAICPGARVGPPDPLSPQSTQAAFRRGLLVSSSTGMPLRADYVLIREGVDIVGPRLAVGARGRLAVWAAHDGVVRLAGPVSSPPCET